MYDKSCEIIFRIGMIIGIATLILIIVKGCQ